MRISLTSFALALVLASFGSVFSGGQAVHAQAKIEAIVNNQAITSYEVNQRARLITLTQRIGRASARKMAKQELIDNAIQLKEAARLGVSVSRSEISSAFGNIAQNVRMSPAQLATALRRSGVNPQTLKDRLKAQIAWSQIVRQRYNAEVNISESDVIAALRKSGKAEDAKSIEYDLKKVIVVVPSKSSGGFRSKRKRESNAIRKQFASCENAGAVLSKYKEVVMKPIGRRLETEIPEVLRKEIEKTKPGHLTSPRVIGPGYEMIAVCARKELNSDISARVELKNEMQAKRGDQMARGYMLQLRNRATIIER